MDTSLADVTNARHHHLPSSPCPYVEHLLLAGLRGKYSLCDLGITSDTTDNPRPRIISPPLCWILL